MGTTMAEARRHGVNVILRDVMQIDWTPRLVRDVILLDDPPSASVLVRYHQHFQVHQWSTNRLAFEQRKDGTLTVTPCPPRRPPHREPNVAYLVEVTRWALAWPVPSPNFDRLLDPPVEATT